MCTRSPEIQPCLGLYQEQCGQQVEGGDSPPLLCSRETPPGSAVSSTGGTNIRRTRSCSSGSRGGQAERVGGVQLEKRRLRGDLRAAFQYLKGVQERTVPYGLSNYRGSFRGKRSTGQIQSTSQSSFRCSCLDVHDKQCMQFCRRMQDRRRNHGSMKKTEEKDQCREEEHTFIQ
uniref:Endothelin-3 n=1 Tax=Bubo bubo TaxID=30461 RepID=A0A8C0F6Y6_BUBBB